MIFSLLIDGISTGSVLALVAAGLAMLAQSTGTINFAHGDFMMFSTFIAYTLLVQLKLPFIVALGGALLCAAIIGFLVERLIIQRLIDSPMASTVMATLGISYILQGIAKDLWSDDIFRFPEIFPGDYVEVGPARISPQSLGIIVCTLLIIAALYLFLNKSKAGTALRAITQNRQAALLMGVRVPRMFSIAWIVAGLLAACAGILLAPTLFLSTGMGSITFMGIIAAIIGGFENIYGAIIGGYILGIFSTILPLFIPTELQGIIPFVLLLIVLFIRPTGIIGKRIVKKV